MARARMELAQSWRHRWTKWLNRRIPPSAEVTLGHRSVFILPTRSGLLFTALLLVLLVTAVNYQNNLIYALTFWLFSISLSAMLFTFRNIAGLTLAAGHVNPVFAGQVVQLPVRLIAAHGRGHEALTLAYPGNPGVMTDVDRHHENTRLLSFRTLQRGPLKTDRLRLESRFPLGLFSAWTWVKLDYQGVVYPAPEMSPFEFSAADVGDQIVGAPSRQSGQQDFHGLRNYQPGDSMRIIAWKQVAQGKGMVSKDFDHDEGARCWLDWGILAPLPTERRLSRLTAWVLEAEQRHWRYGLRLPGIEIQPDNTEVHRDQCLRVLAMYGFNGKGAGNA